MRAAKDRKHSGLSIPAYTWEYAAAREVGSARIWVSEGFECSGSAPHRALSGVCSGIRWFRRCS